MDGNVKKLIIELSIALALILFFGLFKIKVKVSADVLNVKFRIQLYLFGFWRLINLKIYYSNSQILIEKPSGKTSALQIKPLGKFQTKFSFNALKALVEKQIYLNVLTGVENDAYETSLISGAILLISNISSGITNAKKNLKLNVNVNSTAKKNECKIFFKMNLKTSISKIFKAMLVSI